MFVCCILHKYDVWFFFFFRFFPRFKYKHIYFEWNDMLHLKYHVVLNVTSFYLSVSLHIYLGEKDLNSNNNMKGKLKTTRSLIIRRFVENRNQHNIYYLLVICSEKSFKIYTDNTYTFSISILLYSVKLSITWML